MIREFLAEARDAERAVASFRKLCKPARSAVYIEENPLRRQRAGTRAVAWGTEQTDVRP